MSEEEFQAVVNEAIGDIITKAQVNHIAAGVVAPAFPNSQVVPANTPINSKAPTYKGVLSNVSATHS